MTNSMSKSTYNHGAFIYRPPGAAPGAHKTSYIARSPLGFNLRKSKLLTNQFVRFGPSPKL
ncbi:hypothetical protein BDW67DRAFT_14168 [Aspergillus spinulosporus]